MGKFWAVWRKKWPLSITNGVEKYEFHYGDNTAIHYFDEQNAEKIWFKYFKDPQKDVLKKRHVIKVQKYMDDGWVYYYREETKEKHEKRKESGPYPVVPGMLKERMNSEWPWFICKGSEKYVFDYINNTVEHYFDAVNAEKIWFSTIQDPQKDVLELNNVTKRVEKYIVDGWQYSGSYGDNNWPLVISKGNEIYEFDYENNTAIHSWDYSQNVEKLQFKFFQDSPKDALERRNVSNTTRLVVNGWSLDGSYGKKHWPLTMSKGNTIIKFDYHNKTALLYTENKETLKTWFSQFEDPVWDYINQENVIHKKQFVENGWTYSGSYGKYEYPTSMSKGTEKYEFDYKNGCIAYHYVDGRRKEALEFNMFQSPMDVINKRDEAKIREYEFDHRGRLFQVKYLSKYGNYYLPFDIGSDGTEIIGSTAIYKKGTGLFDDVIIDVSQQFNVLTIWVEGKVYDVFEVESSTGVKQRIAEVPQNQLKAYLLRILYSLEGSYEDHSGVYVVIDGSELRLRFGPSLDADTFKWADGTNRHPEVGEKFEYLGESDDFYKIDYNGKELWVSKQYTHVIEN